MPLEKTHPEVGTGGDAAQKPDKDGAKADKKIKKKGKADEGLEIAYDENTRELICTPEKAGRSTSRTLIGIFCRALVIAFAIFSLVFFFSDAFKIEVPMSTVFGYSVLFCLVGAMIFSIKRLRIPGIVIALAGVVFGLFKIPFAYGMATYYNAAIDRFIEAKYYSYASFKLSFDASGYAEEGLLKVGAVAFCFILAVIFVPLFMRRITLPRLIVPALVSTAIMVLVFTYNISRSNWATSLMVASLGALMVMYGCDKAFSRVGARQTEDSDRILFEDDRPELPPELAAKNASRAERKQSKKEKKLARKKQRAERRALNKKRKREGITVDEELASYLSLDPEHEHNARSPKKRAASQYEGMTPEEKKKAKAENRRQMSEHRKDLRRGLRNVKDYKDSVNCSRSSAGGFAAIGAFVLLLVILFIPTVSVEKRFDSFGSLNKKLESYREYLSAWLRGDDPILDIMDYQNSRENNEPHSTDATPRKYLEKTLFTLGTQDNSNVYLRGWIGVDYSDGYWYAADDETLEEYRALFGTDYDPKEIMFLNFYKLMAPDTVESMDYVTRYGSAGNKYGFVSMLVNINRKETGSMHVYMPSYYDTTLGLLNYRTLDKSSISYVDYFDGVYVGRAFQDELDYAAVSYVTTMKDIDWYYNVANLIVKYNFEKQNIQNYKSTGQGVLSSMPMMYYIDRETGYPITEMIDAVQSVIKRTYQSGEVWRTEDIELTEISLFDKYCNYMTDEERKELDYAFRVDDLYSNFVYDTYLGGADSEIISSVLEDILDEMEAYSAIKAAQRDSIKATTYIYRHELTMKIIDWLIANTEYTLEPTAEADPTLDGVENFLTVQKQGYCVQYASAVALMLRQCGIPARYVEGYVGSGFTYNRNSLREDISRYSTSVKDSDAHAWVEVWFDGVGWIQYECTPAYYSDMYPVEESDDPSTDPSIPNVDPGTDDDEPDFSDEEYELYILNSRLSGYLGRIEALEAQMGTYKLLVSDEERTSLEQLKRQYNSYNNRYLDLEKRLNDVMNGVVEIDDFDSNEFLSDCVYLYSEISELDEILSPLEVSVAKYAETFAKIYRILKITLVVVIVAAAVTVVLVLAQRARKKHIASITAIIASPPTEEKRRETATMLIDKTSYLLKIYGSAPRKGEFRHEYAKRLSFEYETLFGFPSEYADDEDVKAKVDASDSEGGSKGRGSKAKSDRKASQKRSKAKTKVLEPDVASKPNFLNVSQTNIGGILDSVAAEEFGGKMTTEEIKALASFYLKLYGAARTRLSPLDWLIRHCIRHQV